MTATRKTHILRPQPPWRPAPQIRAWCGARLPGEPARRHYPPATLLELEHVTRPEWLVEWADLGVPAGSPPPWRPLYDTICSNCWAGASADARRTRWPLQAAIWAAIANDADRDRLEAELLALLEVARAHWDEYVETLEAEQIVAVLASRR